MTLNLIIRGMVGVWIACALMALPAEARWYTYKDCRLIENEFNDGDSFHVRCKKRRYLFRLYFVDAPETDDSIPGRLDEQAAYWGIDKTDALKLADEAAAFTRRFLKDGFTVYSERIDARGRSERTRFFGMAQAGDAWLSEALVAAGLARIYGKRTDLPDDSGQARFLARLRAAERDARRNKRGAWGVIEPEPIGAVGNPIAIPEIEGREMELDRAVSVYSIKTSALLGVLRKGTAIEVVGADSPLMARVRFVRDGQRVEAKCRRADLGL